MKKPNDQYIEQIYSDYKRVNELLQQLYPNDPDYMIYEGCLVDNFIGYGPHIIKGKEFKYLVVLETFKNTWTSWQTVIFTNDDDYVTELEAEFEKESED